MPLLAESHCHSARALIAVGQFPPAIAHLRQALKLMGKGKAWAKLMLALRALSTIDCQ